MTAVIKKASPEDFSRIFTLIQEFALFQKTPEKVSNSVAQMKEEVEFFNGLVAVVDQKIIGFATYYFCYHSWSGKALHLDDLYVQEAFRGQKIGQQLMDQIIILGQNHHCKKVEWQVSNWNTSAIEYYRHLGAEINEVDWTCDLYLEN